MVLKPEIVMMTGDEDTCRQLATIHARAFERQGEKPWSAQEIAQLAMSPGVHLHCLCRADQIVGFVMARLIIDEAEIITLALDPDWQGQGMAPDMLKQSLLFLKMGGAAKVFLEMREDNFRAYKLYTKAGFKENGKRLGYYQTQNGKRLDALTFVLDYSSIDNS